MTTLFLLEQSSASLASPKSQSSTLSFVEECAAEPNVDVALAVPVDASNGRAAVVSNVAVAQGAGAGDSVATANVDPAATDDGAVADAAAGGALNDKATAADEATAAVGCRRSLLANNMINGNFLS